MIKRAIIFAAMGVAAASASTVALARVDVGVFVNTPGPVYAPPPVMYAAPPPPVVYAPRPVYGYGYRGDYDRRGWHHDHGRHRGWERHHGREW